MGGGPGDMGDVSSLGGGLTPQALNISPELLAQVSSLLNLPTAASPLAGSSPTTALPTCDGESTLFTSQGKCVEIYTLNFSSLIVCGGYVRILMYMWPKHASIGNVIFANLFV